MPDTHTLIRELGRHAEPVRPLSRPWLRTAAWLGVSLPYVALLVFVWPTQGHLAIHFGWSSLALEQLAALATGIAAAIAAFATVVPGSSRRVLLLPAAPLALWLVLLGQGCLRDLAQGGVRGWGLMAHWECLPPTILAGALPAAAMAMMLRRGAPLTPHLSTALGGLAAGGLANFAVRFVHPLDVSLIVLAWHAGSIFVLSAAAAWGGRHLLKWPSTAGWAPATSTGP